MGDLTRNDSVRHFLVICNAATLVDQLAANWARDFWAPEFQTVSGLAQLRTQLRERRWDVVLHCLHHSPCTPATTAKMLRDREIDIPLVVVAEPRDERAAYKSLRAGAHDVVFLDSLGRLAPTVEREMLEAAHRADHRAALEMLHDSEARFRALASNLPGLVFNLQRESDGGYRFLYVGDGAFRLLGVKQHELRGAAQRFFDVLHEDDRKRLLVALEVSAHDATPLVWEGRLKQGDGWIDMRSQPHRDEDGAIIWTGIATDISQGKRTEAALRDSRTQLAELSLHMEAVIEEERERIARDIHDGIGSILFRTKTEAVLLAGKLPAEFSGKARSIVSLLDEAMDMGRRVVRELRPGILKEFGLAAAIECQAEDFGHSTGIVCRTQCDEGVEPDPDAALALFRIVQEALTNIAKHAHASLAVVRLRREKGNIALEIRDNGRGIAERDMNKPRSFGLRGIRERVQSLNGSFHIATVEQGGTLMKLRVPLRPGEGVSVVEPEEAVQQDLF